MLKVLPKKDHKNFTIDNLNHVLHDMGVVQKKVKPCGTKRKRLFCTPQDRGVGKY